jgi:hypothetical protein
LNQSEKARFERKSHDCLQPLWRSKGLFAPLEQKSGNFGEMGTERNGFFVHHDEEDDNDNVEAGAQSPSLPLHAVTMSQQGVTPITKGSVKSVLLKGRVPVKVTN